jgi:hypothetical protein
LADELYQTSEEAPGMPYVATAERIMKSRALRRGLRVALRLRFGEAGEAWHAELSRVNNPPLLREVLERVKSAATLDELRAFVAERRGETA